MNDTNRRNARIALLLASPLIGACGSIQETVSTDIDRPVNTAWAVFSDHDRLGEWMHEPWERGGMAWADSDTDAIGTAQRLELKEDGHEMAMTHTITSIRHNEEFAFTLDHDWVLTQNVFRFEPRGADACTIHWDATLNPKEPLSGFVMHTQRRTFQARYEEHLEKLAALIEEQPPG